MYLLYTKVLSLDKRSDKHNLRLYVCKLSLCLELKKNVIENDKYMK